MAHDELYSDPAEGLVLIRRNPLNMKFQTQTFIDVSSIFKDKRSKAVKEFKKYAEFRHPNIVQIDPNYLLLDTPKA